VSAITLAELAKAMRHGVDQRLPEDEPNDVAEWVYERCAEVALAREAIEATELRDVAHTLAIFVGCNPVEALAPQVASVCKRLRVAEEIREAAPPERPVSVKCPKCGTETIDLMAALTNSLTTQAAPPEPPPYSLLADLRVRLSAVDEADVERVARALEPDVFAESQNGPLAELDWEIAKERAHKVLLALSRSSAERGTFSGEAAPPEPSTERAFPAIFGDAARDVERARRHAAAPPEPHDCDKWRAEGFGCADCTASFVGEAIRSPLDVGILQKIHVAQQRRKCWGLTSLSGAESERVRELLLAAPPEPRLRGRRWRA